MTTHAPSWDDLRILLAVHRHRSLLAAAKELGVAASTVARRIEALEEALGRPLAYSSNRGTHIDSDALPLLELGAELELGLRALRRRSAEEGVNGSVRVSVSEGFARFVTHALAGLRAEHPALEVELVVESRVADLARQEADIGVRIVPSSGSTLIDKRVGQAPLGVFASPEYVARRLGDTHLPCAIAGAQDWVGFGAELAHLPHEQWLREYGAQRFVFRSGSSGAREEAIAAGIGIGLIGRLPGAFPDGLVALELERTPPMVDIFLAFQRDARKTPRVRVVIDALEAEARETMG